MSSTTTAIIVGAGISGLTTAALLARRGIDVTLLEAGDRPGGSCSAFRREGVTYDLGAAMLFGFGERGFNPHRWVMEELGESIEVYRHEALYRLNYGNKPVVFWPELPRFIDELSAVFPEARAEFEAFYAAIGELYENVIAKVPVFEAPTELPKDEARRRFLADPRSQLRALSLIFTNAESLLKPYIKDKAARRFFDKLTSTYCYTTLPETPAILAATMFVDNHVGGSYYPASSPMALAARLEKALEAAGGRVRYGSRVAAIHATAAKEGDKRSGGMSLTLASGEELSADVLVFAGAVKELAGDLDPDGLLPRRWKRKILAMDDSWPSFVVYGTVELSRLPANAMPVEMFIDNTEALDEGDVTLYLSGLEDPSLAPEGLSPFLLIGPSIGNKWPTPSDPSYHGEAYKAAKRAEADRMIALVEKRWPGFTAGIRSQIEGSPTTIERYLSKPRGSVAGPKQRMGQHLIFRPSAHSPRAGLYLAGEGTVMGTGTPAVTVSGISAANAILRDLGLPDYRAGIVEGQYVRIIPRGTRGNVPTTALGIEANKCQWCEDPPCGIACPLGLDIPGIMRRLEAGNLAGAAKALHEGQKAEGRNSGCAGCTAACHDAAEEGERPESACPPCEAACTRRVFAGSSVAIAATLEALEKNGR